MTFAIDKSGGAPVRAARSAPPEAPAWRRWIPVRSLAAHHRPRILAHLVALPEADRYLRFGHLPSDAQIARYVDHIDFERDEVFGIFNRRLDLIALAHLASLGQASDGTASAEFGVSVGAAARRRGLGSRLFHHAMLRARHRAVDTLVIHALSENAAMLHIARSAGATILRDGPDSTARLGLPHEDVASFIEALAQQHAAEFDYGFKLHAQRVDGLLRQLADWQPGR